MRESSSLPATLRLGDVDVSRDDFPLPNTTTSAVLRLHGTTLSLLHLESMIHHRLRCLDLKDVKIQGPPGSCVLPTHLTELIVDPVIPQLDGVPGCLADLPRLKKLTMGLRSVSWNDIKAFNATGADLALSLYDCRDINDLELLLRLKRLRHLRFVNFGDSAFPKWLRYSHKITALSFENGRLMDSLMDPIASMDIRCPRGLRRLELNCQIDEKISSYLLNHASRLKELTIRAPSISIWIEFSKLQRLETIKLFGKEVDADILQGISCYLKKLQVLHFGGSVVLDENKVRCLLHLSNLREILISNARIGRGGLTALLSHPSLSRLELHSCHVLDPLPETAVRIHHVSLVNCLFCV